jgi:hypothetical protein
MDKTIESMVNLCTENKPSLILSLKLFDPKVHSSIILKYWLVSFTIKKKKKKYWLVVYRHNIFSLHFLQELQIVID